MRVLIAIISFFLSLEYCSAQFAIIPTGINSTITEIHIQDSFALINGNDGYLGKCHGECYDLTELASPNYMGYFQTHLNMIDTSRLYITSHYDFPDHILIFKSENGGNSWTTLLDTSDYFFSEFFMFDSLTGSLVSTFYNSIQTSDAVNWSPVSHGLIISSSSARINDSTAIMGTNQDFNYTIDKGQTWLTDPGFVQSPPVAFFSTVLDTIYAVTNGGNGIYFTYTHDLLGGAWVSKTIPDFIPGGIYVKSELEIYVTGQRASNNRSQVYRTTDLGNTWSYFDVGINGILRDIEFVNDSVALIGGDNGLLIRWNKNSDFNLLKVKELEMSDDVIVYPNPSSGLVNIQTDFEISRVELWDIKGSLIGTFDKLKELQIEDKGVYIIKIYCDDHYVKTRRVIVK